MNNRGSTPVWTIIVFGIIAILVLVLAVILLTGTSTTASDKIGKLFGIADFPGSEDENVIIPEGVDTGECIGVCQVNEVQRPKDRCLDAGQPCAPILETCTEVCPDTNGGCFCPSDCEISDDFVSLGESCSEIPSGGAGEGAQQGAGSGGQN